MRTRRIMIVAGLLGLSLVVAGCQTPGLGVREPVTMARLIQGNDPGLKYSDVFVVNSKSELQERQSQELVKLDIDFDNCSLVVFAVGECPTAGYWAHITGVQCAGDDVFVQAQLNAPAKDHASAAMVTYPYSAAVVAKIKAVKTCHAEPEYVEGQPMPTDQPSAPAPVAAPSAMP